MSEIEKHSSSGDGGQEHEAIREFLRQNAEQLEIRKRELELQGHTDVNNFEYAKLALSAQAEDLQHQRQHEEKLSRGRYRFVGFSLVVVVLFLCFTLYLGKEQFAEDLAKVLLGVVTGGASGYLFGKSKGEERAAHQQNQAP